MQHILTVEQAYRINHMELVDETVDLVMFTPEEISQQPSREGLAKEVLYNGVTVAGKFSPEG